METDGASTACVASDHLFGTVGGDLEQLQEHVRTIMPSPEAVAGELWRHLHDILEKSLAVYVTNAVTEVMARHMPGVLNHQESMTDKVCADPDQVAHLHQSRSALFPESVVQAKQSGKQSDLASVAMSETMDCNEILQEKMQDMALHKCSERHAELFVGAEKNKQHNSILIM